jgi:hypothetical protein
LSTPEWFELEFTQSLYSREKHFFSRASLASEDACGEVTYKLIDAETGSEYDGDVFTIEVNSGVPHIVGVIHPRDPHLNDSPFVFEIEASVAGKTATSGRMAIYVSDPCGSATLEAQVIEDFAIQRNIPDPAVISFQPYKDSVSKEFSGVYGDGSAHDLCGP